MIFTDNMKKRRRCKAICLLPLVLIFFLSVPAVDGQQDLPKDDAEEYIIGAGDVLDVHVYGEPDVSSGVIVRIDGRVSFPLAGEIEAAGKTPGELTENIRQKLEKFIESPEVTVMLSEGKSKTYYVLGQIASPGEYHISRPFTVLQAIARAGGFREWAKKDRIMIIGGPGTDQKITYFDYDAFLNRPGSVKHVIIKPGDTIVIP